MKIIQEKTRYHRFALYFEYTRDRVAFCQMLKGSFGWQAISFDTSDDKKRWVFSDPVFIKLFVERFPETELGEGVEGLVKLERAEKAQAEATQGAREAVKNKVDTDFVVNNIKGEMYPYQRVGVEFLEAARGRALIASEPGTGKSLQALGYIAHNGFQRVLVISPASVKPSWMGEIEKWTNLKALEIDSKTKIEEIPADVNIWVINYEILKKNINTLLKTRFDVVVADESHLIKSPKAQRTKAVKAITQSAPRVVFLTGTPVLSRPVEMFTMLNMLDPKTWNNYYDFTRRYCEGHQGKFGYDASGASNTEELHERIKGYFIRHRKKDVLSQLPPVIITPRPVDLSSEWKRAYDLAEDNLVKYLREVKGKKNREILRSIQAEKLTQLNILRHAGSMGKVKAAKELIDSLVDAGEKVLVFSMFKEPLAALSEAYSSSQWVKITGDTPVGERGEIVKKFQSDPGVQIFFGGIRSAGVGITLTAASNVVFLDYAWTPADMEQARDRVNRPGQEAQSVNVYELYTPGTVDQKMRSLLSKKENIIERVVDGVFEEESEANIQDEIFKFVMEKHS